MNGALFWSWLHILTKDRLDAILQVYADLEEARAHFSEEFLQGLGCKRETIYKMLEKAEDFDEEKYAKRIASLGLTLITIADDEYPARLKEIGDPPPFLYYKGDLSILGQPTIGLVGTRQMSQYGRRVTDHFVPDFVSAGMVTVSGLAQGIDARVAEETLKAGGKTVAVLGHGLGMIFPQSNAKLADQIIDQGGLLLSEFPVDYPPDTYTFPSRNRIVAGLSLGVVVLEAPKGSGAIITANLALEYSRDVFIVPGQIFDGNYEGSHELLGKGQAKLVTSAAEVLVEVGVVAPTIKESSFVPSTSEEEKVFGVLTTMPQSMDDLVQKSGMNTAAISATLTMMELSGGAKNIGGGMWVKA